MGSGADGMVDDHDAPRSIRILGHTWALIPDNRIWDEASCFGQAAAHAQEIRFCPTAHVEQQQNTVMHELLHAVKCSLGHSDEEVETTGQGTALASFLRDPLNQAFLDWMRGA